jgi:electron transport complex protein RnfG
MRRSIETLSLTAWLVGAGLCPAAVILTENEALERAFPGASFERKVLYLTEDQVDRVQKRARSRLPSAIVTMVPARIDGKLVGRAYLDTHTVRTMPETVLTAVGPDGELRAVLVLQFAEPMDYLPHEKWLSTFDGKSLDDDLWPGRNVRRVTGATLTVQSLTESVRRSLAIDGIVHEESK